MHFIVLHYKNNSEEREDNMRNYKAPLICAAVLYFCLCNKSFAIQEVMPKTHYPDFACEFTGKDKCEKFNRKLFIFNLALNKYIVRPISIGWASVMPQYGIDRFKSAYQNMNSPIRILSSLLQKDFKTAKRESVRFLTNTTVGFAGFYDPAKNYLKIEPRQEDMGQVLAHYHVKQGPYLVLPIVRGSIRDLVGQLLDCPLRPCSYIPIAGGAVTAFFTMNDMTTMQPIIKKVEENYADPYEIVRQIDGIDRYIKNSNIDREDFLQKPAKTGPQDVIQINNVALDSVSTGSNLKADIELKDYKPQSPLIDSMRNAMFDNKSFNNSIWSDVSVWNRSFDKKIKIESVNITDKKPKYRYRYLLQKNKTSPVAILYPSIGEGIMSDQSNVFASILYSLGYSVIIQGSAFNWEFIKSMPDGYKPGLPYQDAKYLRLTTAKILKDVQTKKGCKFKKKILIGTSWGALTGLFTAAQEAKENTLNISHYVSICPPVKIFYSMEKLDNYTQDWQNNPSDIKVRAAVTAEKTLQAAGAMTDKTIKIKPEVLPFNDDEAKLIVGFIMKQKLSDTVFAIEKGSRAKKTNIYDSVNNLTFNDYAKKYLFVNLDKTQVEYDTSLYSLSDFLQQSKNYKIYHSCDDYFTNPEQLIWLKKQTGNKSTFFSNGSHLGFLYRKEFVDDFKKDITTEETAPPESGL